MIITSLKLCIHSVIESTETGFKIVLCPICKHEPRERGVEDK